MSTGLLAFLIVLIAIVFVAIIVGIGFAIRFHRKGEHKAKQTRKFLVFDKGQRTENFVSTVLKKMDIEDAYLVQDLIIPTRNGKSSQIDNILVTHKGIFVIECKNWNGTIVGGEDDGTIFQVDVSGNYKHPRKNPLKQNRSHVYALSHLLGLSLDVFIPVVVFKTDNLMLAIDNPSVITLGQLKMFILIQLDREDILSTQDIEKITMVLKDHKDNPRVSEEEHIENIRASHPDSYD